MTLSFDRSIIEGPYLRDILSQPKALDDTCQAFDVTHELEKLANRLRNGRFPRIVLTGMGSSYHALHPMNLELVNSGFTAITVETSELVHYAKRYLDSRTLIVAVSQSGRSAEILRLLEIHKGRSPVIGVTNTAASPLATESDAVVLTHAGDEFSVSCKTYTTGLMALEWLSGVLTGKGLRHKRSELAKAQGATAEYLEKWKKHVDELLALLEGIRHLFLAGRGTSLAAVGAGALIIKEADHFPAEGMSSAAFRHGPIEMLRPEIFVLVFSGDAKSSVLNQKLLEDVRDHGGRAASVGTEVQTGAFHLPKTPACLRPILEILPVQMITLALAAHAGREPGKFEITTKVTTTE